VLSDEAPGHLIANMVAAGYGELNLYDALLQLQADSHPALAGLITPAFLSNLANCAVGSQVFTTELTNVTGVAISDDCSVQTVNLQGSAFSGQPGITTLVTNLTGVGSATAVSANPVTSWTQNVAVGSGTATVTYNAFAVLYAPESAPPATPLPPSLWLVAAGGLSLLARRLWRRRGA
jgi:hypothetical protein